MDPRFAAADAAARANQVDEAIRLLEEAIPAAAGKAPVQAYRRLASLHFNARRFDDARRWATEGVERHPKDFDLWNILGVAYRRLGRLQDGIAALDQAQKLNPKNQAAWINKANLYNDMGDGARALEQALKLVRADPANAEHHRTAALAYRHMNDLDKAAARLDIALRLQPGHEAAWLDRATIASGLQRHDDAIQVIDRAIAAMPGSVKLKEAKAFVLRRAGRHEDAQAYLREALAQDPNCAWAEFQLGRTLIDSNREQANVHLKRAAELAPSWPLYHLFYAESLERSRFGDEGANIEEAYQTLIRAQAMGAIPPEHTHIARQISLRVGDYARLESFGTLSEVGRRWARANNHGSLMQNLGRVKAPEDRYEVLEQHRIWGERAMALASRNPVARAATPRPPGKIRLGFLSSDLRSHPVGYFVLPLFDFIDLDRFEVYCYAFNQQDDNVQKYIASKVTEFRWRPVISDRDAAQMIADDQLDILIELGGSTHMNKLEVMAYKPARLQASWLGYPHSAGLDTIDYIVVDPYMTPPDPKLLIERPMTMPKTWLALGRGQFRDEPAVNPDLPEDRNGFLTFGTANNPHKYGPEMLRTWAQVVAATPGSRFMFVRPEGGAPSFRRNMLAFFEAEGVSADRVRFQAVRGAHLPFYNEIDIALDTFPLTGGTTTCETLWMGVPVVSLKGQALFERLSYSLLTNAGVADLVADDPEQYKAIAAALAADKPRRAALRAGLREQLRASPLGQTQQFARDFYDLVERTVRSHA